MDALFSHRSASFRDQAHVSAIKTEADKEPNFEQKFHLAS